ncbi:MULTISPECIES: hypothetical protein [unclassified Beijerinckia]|uniref:hypothetical protein n=1 Tax=unclassified Beijerinckia TaxID=2638183 RepID=UPI000894733F|nr:MULTISPECIES: hypothetical protein [unclassified Beijerinckia]MDH7796260.1 hypothetical protein [Beijerinckia sp. GAS462]SEC37360.1 hypothetical protein SAMN05443249_2543 [Beijerinckia sp. 28-YEA-48]
MTPYRKIFAASLGILAVSSAAQAQDADYCSPFDAARQATSSLALRTVKDEVKRLHFINSEPNKAGCPSLEASCQLPSFVVGGDRLLVSSVNAKKLACVHYFSKAGKLSSGFVDASALNVASTSGEKLSSRAGLGAWSNGNTGLIEIKPATDNYVVISGEINRGPPSFNSGSLNGPAFLSIKDDGKSAGYADDHYDGTTSPTSPPDTSAASFSCKARLRLMGDFLIVDDNDNCGGHGVMFTGLYKKKP